MTVFKINAYAQTSDVPYATIEALAGNQQGALEEARAKIEMTAKPAGLWPRGKPSWKEKK